MFNALLATKDDQHEVAVTQIDKGALADSGVLVKVDYSTINYKDALAVTATAPIIRKYPLVPGIDLAGTIEESDDPDWQVGERVVVNGWGMGEGHSGGLAQYARVPASFLVKLPQNMSTRHAMAIGTAGYTASRFVSMHSRHKGSRLTMAISLSPAPAAVWEVWLLRCWPHEGSRSLRPLANPTPPIT